ncbi:MAG TPA: AMP-binding protein [Planctomycetota bacterium]|nr:AMP-binding protein [Planctomycetota bacterium]
MKTHGSFHNTALEKSSIAELAAGQKTRLHGLLQQLSENRFYKARFKAAGIKSSDLGKVSLEDLPFLTKADLVADQARAAPFGSNLSFPLAHYCRYHQTSGSTGSPLRWLDTRESWEWMLGNWSWIYASAGVTPKDRICFAFSFGPFLGFWTAFESAVRYGALCFPAGGLSTSARLRFILDNGITVVCCTPTYALRMAEVAEEEKINIALSPVRLLLVAGEPGGSVPQTRSRIEEAWGARCVDHYGMTEVGPACFECEKNRGRLHVIDPEYIAECVDPKTGKPVADGESGELILTNLGRSGSPAIRYRTGDLVKLSRRSPCECGRSFVALDGGILGRVDDMLVVRGINVYPSAIEDVVRRFADIAEFRVEVRQQRSMTELKVSIEGCGPDTAATAKQLCAEFQRVFSLRIPVEVVGTGTLPRFEMKAKRWIRVRED